MQVRSSCELIQEHALLQQKDTEIWHKDEESGRQYAILLHEHQQLQQERDQLRRERDQLQQESSHSLSAKPVSCSHLFVSISANSPGLYGTVSENYTMSVSQMEGSFVPVFKG